MIIYITFSLIGPGFFLFAADAFTTSLACSNDALSFLVLKLQLADFLAALILLKAKVMSLFR